MPGKNEAGLAVPGNGEADERQTDRPAANQPAQTENQTADIKRPEDEPTGEGAGARAGEYS